MGRFFQEIFKAFLFGYQVLDLYGTLPLKYNLQNSQMEPKSSGKLRVNWLIIQTAGILLLCGLFQFIFYWSESSTTVQAYSMMALSHTFMALFSTYASSKNPQLLAAILNGMLNFETIHFPESTKKFARFGPRKFVKFVIILWFGCIHFFLFTNVLNVLGKPCFPHYVGFYIVSECNVEGHLGMIPKSMMDELGWKLCVAGGAIVYWIVIFPGLHLHVCLMAIQGYAMRSYILQNKR